MCFLPPIGFTRQAFPTGPNLLADFDFSAPATVGIDGNGTFASAYATDEWFDFTSATVSNNVGTETLANTGGLLSRVKAGLWTGSTYAQTTGWESGSTAANSDTLVSSGATAGDSALADFAGRLVFRTSRGAWPSGDYLLTKWLGGVGWFITTSTSERLSFNTDDGPTLKTITLSGTGLCNGAWHALDFWYDASTVTLYMKTDIHSEISGVATGQGTLANAGNLSVNSLNGAASGGSPHIQPAYVGVSVGVNAKNFYDETVVLPGADPTGLLTTQTRASLISVPVSATAVAHFSDDQLPIGYNANFSDANKLGLLCNNVETNLVPYSELSTGSANTNITPTDNASDAPDGFRSATQLLATAANGNQAKTCTTTASTQYTATAYIEEFTAGVTGRVIMYDESNAAELGATAFTGTGSPQEISVTASTIAGGISTSVRVEVDTDTETVIAWGWGLREGAGTEAIVRTSGASASTVQSNYRATGNHVQESEGELEAVFVLKVLPPTGEDHYVFDTVATADRRALYVDDAGALKFLVNDGAGSLVAEITLGTVAIDTEYTARCQWDEAAGLDSNSVRGKINSDAKVSAGSSFTSGSGYTAEICVGASDTTADTALGGIIQHIESYDGPKAMAA